MKAESSVSAILKTIIIITGLTFGLTGFTISHAQSVVGKWKRTGTKIFTTDKASGKQVSAPASIQQQYSEAMAARGYTELIEFKSDNTYVSTISTAGNGKPMMHNGKYTLSGKDLDMGIPLVNNQKTTITIQTINGSTMIWDHVFMGKLMEIIYTKM